MQHHMPLQHGYVFGSSESADVGGTQPHPIFRASSSRLVPKRPRAWRIECPTTASIRALVGHLLSLLSFVVTFVYSANIAAMSCRSPVTWRVAYEFLPAFIIV